MAAAALLPRRRDDPPWRLAALGGPDVARDVAAMRAMGVLANHAGEVVDADEHAFPSAVVDALEVKASTVPRSWPFEQRCHRISSCSSRYR